MKAQLIKCILGLILFAFSNQYCVSQTNDAFKPTIIDFYNQLKFQTAVTENEADNITGSPYLDSSFYQGFIVTADSLVYQGVHMRYNNYKDVVEFKKKDNEIYEIPISFPIIQLKFGGNTLERKEYQSDNGGRYGFFQPILEGEISLFRQQRVILEKAKMASLYNASKLPHFKVNPFQYYLQKDGDKKLVFFSNKKELLKLLHEKEDKIRFYMKVNKLSLKKEKDIVQIIDYYNSILE